MAAPFHPFDDVAGPVVPGFVDIQLNGAFGHDFTADPDSIWEVARLLPRLGVTAFVPTVISAPSEVAVAALAVLAAGPPSGWAGATPIGLHVEGPMISRDRRGAHPEEVLTDPSDALVSTLIESGPPLMVTLAPELEGASSAIRRLVGAGTIVAIGHSDATAGEAGQAVEAGARHVTHLFNAMSGLDHRRPGVAATALVDDRLTVGLIADGVHVAPEMLRLAYREKGTSRIALVTDGIAAVGLGDGTHRIGSVPVTVEGITVRTADGTLAGSGATMSHVLATMRAATGCSIDEAAAMASTTPARIVGHHHEPGDLVLLDDDLEVVATSLAGVVVHHR